jgi:hypothetical protein
MEIDLLLPLGETVCALAKRGTESLVCGAHLFFSFSFNFSRVVCSVVARGRSGRLPRPQQDEELVIENQNRILSNEGRIEAKIDLLIQQKEDH